MIPVEDFGILFRSRDRGERDLLLVPTARDPCAEAVAPVPPPRCSERVRGASGMALLLSFDGEYCASCVGGACSVCCACCERVGRGGVSGSPSVRRFPLWMDVESDGFLPGLRSTHFLGLERLFERFSLLPAMPYALRGHFCAEDRKDGDSSSAKERGDSRKADKNAEGFKELQNRNRNQIQNLKRPSSWSVTNADGSTEEHFLPQPKGRRTALSIAPQSTY